MSAQIRTPADLLGLFWDGLGVSTAPVPKSQEPAPERARFILGELLHGTTLLCSWPMDLPVPLKGERVEGGPYSGQAVASGRIEALRLTATDGFVLSVPADALCFDTLFLWTGCDVTLDNLWVQN